MTRRAALGVVLVLVSAAVMGATVSPASAHDAKIVAYLTGEAERPGPGDPDGVGRAYITTHLATNQVCLVLQWANVDGTLSGLHIHRAPATSPGPIVVGFATPSGGSGHLRQCARVPDSEALHNIAHNPQQHYINLHSTPLYGAGAIRGQLRRI